MTCFNDTPYVIAYVITISTMSLIHMSLLYVIKYFSLSMNHAKQTTTPNQTTDKTTQDRHENDSATRKKYFTLT